MGTTYLTNEQWAILKGYATFAAYIAANDYPPAITLDAMRDRAYAIINNAMGSTSATSGNANFLYDLEYRMVELMIDEEEARQNGQPRPQFIPRDYLFERDRQMLDGIDATINRGVSN